MNLSHDIYEEAMENVKLSDEKGMRLLEEAAYQKQQRGQRWKLRASAIVAAILTVSISLNGICYAQTGKTALEMFMSLYERGDMEEVGALVRETKICGDFIVYENMKFTLVYYWYDQENVEAFFAIRVDSLNGTPLDAETVQEMYYILPGGGWYSSSNNPGYETIGDGTSLMGYYYTAGAYDKSGNPVEKMSIRISKYQTEIGTFELEPTGQARARYADFDVQGKDSMQIRITGAGLKVFLSDIWDMEDKTSPRNILDKEHKPFRVLDVVMKDGAVYRADTTPLSNYHGEEIVVTEEEENIHKCDWECFMGPRDENWAVFSFSFRDYIDVDDIAGVYIDGTELTLK